MLQAPDDDFQIDLPFISLNSRNRSEKESWKPSTLLIVKNKICSNTHASLTGVLLCYFQFTVLFFQQLLWHARKLFHKGLTLIGVMNIWVFNSIACIFLTTGLYMIFILKKHFPTFYKEFSAKILIATLFHFS